jgi:hypothetical protein
VAVVALALTVRTGLVALAVVVPEEVTPVSLIPVVAVVVVPQVLEQAVPVWSLCGTG